MNFDNVWSQASCSNSWLDRDMFNVLIGISVVILIIMTVVANCTKFTIHQKMVQLNTWIKIRNLRQKTSNHVASCMKTHLLPSTNSLHCAIEDMKIPNDRAIFKIVNSSYDTKNVLIILTPRFNSDLYHKHWNDTIYIYNSTTNRLTRNDNDYPFLPILTRLCDKYGDDDPRLHPNNNNLYLTYEILPFEGWGDDIKKFQNSYYKFMSEGSDKINDIVGNSKRCNVTINGFNLSNIMLMFGQFGISRNYHDYYYYQKVSASYQFIGLFDCKRMKMVDILYDSNIFSLDASQLSSQISARTDRSTALYERLTETDRIKSPYILYKHWLILENMYSIQIYQINFTSNYNYNYNSNSNNNINNNSSKIKEKEKRKEKGNILKMPTLIKETAPPQSELSIQCLFIILNKYNSSYKYDRQRALFSSNGGGNNSNGTNIIHVPGSNSGVYRDHVRLLVSGEVTTNNRTELIEQFTIVDLKFVIDYNIDYTLSTANSGTSTITVTNVDIEILENEDKYTNIKVGEVWGRDTDCSDDDDDQVNNKVDSEVDSEAGVVGIFPARQRQVPQRGYPIWFDRLNSVTRSQLLGRDLNKNLEFFKCFAIDKVNLDIIWYSNIEFVNQRYLVIIGAEISKTISKWLKYGGMRVQNEFYDIGGVGLIVYDFIRQQWMFKNDILQDIFGKNCNPNEYRNRRPSVCKQIGQSIYIFTYTGKHNDNDNNAYNGNGNYNYNNDCTSKFLSIFQSCRRSQQRDNYDYNYGYDYDYNYNNNGYDYGDVKCWKLNLESYLSWDIERIIWIGYYKNIDNDKCLITKLPKDVILHVLKLSKCGIFESKTNFL